jgi:uncharacterized protein (TIGR00369 family)
MDMAIERDSYCFCCGKDNERGLHLTFSYPRKGSAETDLTVPDYFQGWRNITHGGFLSTLLDEVMAHSCIGIAKTAVTAEMTVKFKKPVKTGTRIKVSGEVVEEKGRVIGTRGWVFDDGGAIMTEADAKFIIVDGEKPVDSTAKEP